MLTAIQKWQKALSEEIKARFGLELPPDEIPFTFPPKPELGDAATPVCFSLARKLKRPPQVLAQELAQTTLDGVRESRCAGGYLNLFVDRGWAIESLLGGRFVPKGWRGKTIIEHTNINPNKAAHVGHLRNAVLGDTLARCLRYLGREVEVQNYIDDTGVQVADVVVGFERILGFGPEQLEALLCIYERFATKDSQAQGPMDRLQEWLQRGGLSSPDGVFAITEALRPILADPEKSNLAYGWLVSSKGRFDSFCWELYAKVAHWYAEDDSRLKARHETLRDIEGNVEPTSTIAARVAEEMVRCHLRTMERLHVRYDVLPHESDILKSGFWQACFDKLKAAGAVHRVPDESGDKNRGCWVMALSEADGFEGLSDADKVIVRSSGTVTYIGKDMAYQLWKFGLLGRDFKYRLFPNPLYRVWRSSSTVAGADPPSFGHGESVINVIDVRQSYLQRIVREGLKLMGYKAQAEASVHFSYEMVALSRKTALELEQRKEITLCEEDRTKPFVEMSGRKGLGVQADVLLDLLEERAQEEVSGREPELPKEEADSRARLLAASALRYYMAKYDKNQVVAFDFDQALAFEGETGPYLQYACVRAENILRKAAEMGIAMPEMSGSEAVAKALGLMEPEGWGVLALFLRLPNIVQQATSSLDLHLVARHLYQAAQAFHAYYHAFPVIQEPDPQKREARLLTVLLFARLLRSSLQELLGIEVPERM
ncbi:MAG: arginine--tRNA ligase [Acidobacteria bacterium]|nr:arginine--tRNA ligase [Acidobacteriota bacterium]